MALKKSSMLDILLVCVYETLLSIIFVRFILPLHGYEVQIAQTTGGSVNYVKVALSYVVTCVAVFLFRSIGVAKRASRFVMLIQLLMIVVPFCVLYGYLNYPTWQLALVFLGYGGAVLAINVIPSIRLPLLSIEVRRFFIFLAASIIFYVYVGLVTTGGIQRINFDFSQVYKVRAGLSGHEFPLSGYFIPWVAYVLNMAILTYSLSIRGRSLIKSMCGVFLVILMQVMLFGMTNFKAFIFLPFVIVFLVLFMGKINLFRSAVMGVSVALCCLIVLSMVGVMFSIAIVDRVFVTPSAIHSLYFNYFSTHPLGLLQGTVGKLFGSSYDESIIVVISKFYWGRVFSPNVGWIADAFSNFGVIGVPVYSLILALSLRVVDGFVDERMPSGMVEGLLFGFAFGITNTALLTSLLTGGYVVAVVALWVMTSRWRRVSSVILTNARVNF